MSFRKITATKFFIVLTLLVSSGAYSFIGRSWENERPPMESFDPGPDQNDKLAKELIDLTAKIPYYPGISTEIMKDGDQKFRPAYGPIPWRMILKPNNVKILFIGQDGTHVAEAAGRPATAGFGGRAQDLANFFGVEYSAAFINAYAYTIQGQYSARNAPYVVDGKIQTKGSITPNDVWIMGQDKDSPISKWRSDLIEWIIKNNSKSLKLIVLFGQAAKDSVASFVESRGGKVGSSYENRMNEIQVPEFMLAYAGGNNEFPVAYSRDGSDLYQKLLGKLDYKGGGANKAINYIENNSAEVVEQMVFTKAGPYKNGLIHPAQMGGYDLDKIYVSEEKYKLKQASKSLKGLKLKNGQELTEDILVIALPHPTFLSSTMNETATTYWQAALKDNETYKSMLVKAGNLSEDRMLDFMKKVLKALPDQSFAKTVEKEGYQQGKDAVARLVEKDVEKIRPYKEKGWKIHPDIDENKSMKKNTFDEGKMYAYGRSDIHNVFYDFGTPQNRMVSESTARRGSHKDENGREKGSQIIIFGSRDVPGYDKEKINKMLSAFPNQELSNEEMFITRMRGEKSRYIYDEGPIQKYAELMKNLDYGKIYTPKNDMSFDKDGIDAYNIKSHPEVGDFGHYRGTFKNPKVLILADPDGYDDLITARALTGTRGQYLQGMLDDLGIHDQYLVIKTVPFGMDNATDEEWSNVLDITKTYREKMISELVKDYNFEMIIADGEYAYRKLQEILPANLKSQLVQIKKEGLANNSGIKEAMDVIKTKIIKFSDKKYLGKMKNIPKAHLSYYARSWEGTCGDRVIDSIGKSYQGLAFLEVVPNWVVNQKPKMLPDSIQGLEILKQKLDEGNYIMPREKISEYCAENDCSL